ncbi:MAG: hypothetical protein K0S76_1004 [Herbinix sp.]|jgi:hypothetical protein|nr:hypothetical protein [Herbinix sp.]
MSNVQRNINKVSKALKAKGIMPLINQEQFYGEYGPVTKYIIHYGKPKGKNNDAIAEVYGKVELLRTLIYVLKAGDVDG